MVDVSHFHGDLFEVQVSGNWIKHNDTVDAWVHELAEDEDILKLSCLQVLKYAGVEGRRARLATKIILGRQTAVPRSCIGCLRPSSSCCLGCPCVLPPRLAALTLSFHFLDLLNQSFIHLVYILVEVWEVEDLCLPFPESAFALVVEEAAPTTQTTPSASVYLLSVLLVQERLQPRPDLRHSLQNRCGLALLHLRGEAKKCVI